MGDIDTEAVDSLKTLDPKRPIREATKQRTQLHVGSATSGHPALRPELHNSSAARGAATLALRV